ncbi:16S rRNA (guanine(527)-N(7))-methyltransferase RsmG [Fluviicola sp.]|uniref:16S rRNA (guanine(527)-N(7))-methyltransferase RsmG n=1 Tax=Fluviicola sp. TaxID=1917219 RepID=UPI0031D3A3E3
MELISKYFPDLTDVQRAQFGQLKDLYEHWNAQINVISRKDMDEFYERHVLHSLGIAKIMAFAPGSHVLDIGTGGGFPGIPLAILFPEVQFHLVDSIGKKIKVVKEVAAALNLQNVRATHARAEEIKEQFDFIVSRAVTAMPAFLPWTKGKFLSENKNPLPNGILYLKGGDLTEEFASVKQAYTIHPLQPIFPGEFFETKAVVYVKMKV